MKHGLALAALSPLVFPVYVSAQEHLHHSAVKVEDLKWSAPAAYAKGAQLAVVRGDPTKEGMYVVRLKVPAGFKIGPPTHPNDENVTVLSGTFVGTGDKADESKTTSIKGGAYSYVAKGMTHFASFPEETVLQLHGMGPQGISYVDPKDDPRKAQWSAVQEE